jgi:hypothetical protein
MSDRRYDVRRGLPSASAMYRISKCPGSLALINRLRAEGRLYRLSNQWAGSGTRIHHWLDLRVQHDKARKKTNDNGEPAPVFPDIDKELTRIELGLGEKCEELRQELIGQWAAPRTNPELELITETRLWYRQGVLPRFSAQADFIAINRPAARAFICQYKTGRLEADPAADNLQLRTEIVAFAQDEPEITEIDGAIVEPLVSWDSERVNYKADTLREAENQIVAIADAALWHSHERFAGAWCVNCPARANCPEARRYIESIPVPREGKELMELPRGEAGTNLWLKIQAAEKILKSLEAAYERILEDEPNALPGLVLPKQGHKRRIVPYPSKLKHALIEYLSADEVDGCAEYYVGKIEELFGLKQHLRGAALAKKFESLTSHVIDVTHDKPFIRPLTKREREQPAQAKVIQAERAFQNG